LAANVVHIKSIHVDDEGTPDWCAFFIEVRSPVFLSNSHSYKPFRRQNIDWPRGGENMASKDIVGKVAVERVVQRRTVQARLVLWQDINFSGRALRFRGSLGVRSLSVFSFNDMLSSFRFSGNRFSTLVLFQDDNYQGRRLVFRGPTRVASLLNINTNNFNWNDQVSSFIMSTRFLSNAEINRIQNRGRAPAGFAEVLK
jgi:hypothetical protein